jgi:hypothetical protein
MSDCTSSFLEEELERCVPLRKKYSWFFSRFIMSNFVTLSSHYYDYHHGRKGELCHIGQCYQMIFCFSC